MNKTDSSHNPSDRQKLEDIGYPYLNSKKEDGSYNVPTLNESLYWHYAAGIISLHDAAREFTSHGWTNFVDEDFTKKKFAEIDLKYHKLDYDLKPLSPEQIAMQKVEQQIAEFKEATGIQLEDRDGKPYYDGKLDLADSKIEKLPDNLTVNGLLNLINSNIKELPDNLTVNGSLWLENTKIERLPENMSIKGGLWLEKTNIERLPDNLTVKSDLNLSDTPIKELPMGLKVGKDLILSNTSIKELPDNLTVGGDLDLYDTPIRELPENITIGKNLYLENTQIERLPDNLTVNGMLDLTNTPIKALPKNLTVNGSLELSNSKIERLSENLSVKGDLNLRYTSIKELPDNLTVGLCLDLSNTPIEKLPKNLTVGWMLDLTNTSVTELPADLKVKDDIYMNNRRIPAIPDNISPDGYIDLVKAGAPIAQKQSETLQNAEQQTAQLPLTEFGMSAALPSLEANKANENEQYAVVRIPDWSGGYKHEIMPLKEAEEMVEKEPFHYIEWSGNMEKLLKDADNVVFENHIELLHEEPRDYQVSLAALALKNNIITEKNEILTPKEYTTMWMTSIAEKTPKDRPSDIVFIKDFNLEDTSKPIYTAYGKDADRLAEKISSSVAAMRPEIEGKRYPYADISDYKIEAVRADLMINNVHPIIIDVEGNRITNDTKLDFTKEERKAFLDSLKPEAKQREDILQTIQKLGNPERINIPNTSERFSHDQSLMIPQRFGYQEIAFNEIKRFKDGSYRAGNSEEGYYPIAKMDTNNLFEVQQALQKVVANRPENLVKELVNQVNSGKAEVSHDTAKDRYIININDQPGERNYPRGFKQFTVGADMQDHVLLHDDRGGSRTSMIKVDSKTIQQLVNYAESKLGLADIHPTQIADVSQKFEASVTQRQGQAYMTAKVDDRQLDSKQISKQDWADYKNHKTSAQQLINKYYSKEEISQANPQKINSGRGR